jgi:predicted metalloprotease with PDZ domain
MLALCLDLEIMKLTNGEKDLRNVLLDLTKEYDENNPIPENELIDIIIEKTHPELKNFFDNYIRGNGELLINHYLHYAGARYFLFEEINQSIPLVSPEYGIRKISQNPWKVLINGKITVTGVTDGSAFKVGDKLNFFEFQNQVKDEYGFDKMSEGEIVTLNVVNNGEKRRVNFPLKYRKMTKSDHYRIDKEADSEKLNIRRKWWNY